MAIYEVLRQQNPSQYMYNIHFDDVKIIANSPEALVSKNKDILTIVPIASVKEEDKRRMKIVFQKSR